MISTWHRVTAISSADRRLVVEAAFLIAIVRIAIAILPFNTVRQMTNAVVRFRRTESSVSVRRVGWAIVAAGRRLPGTTCLVSALAADAMLRRRDHDSELRFGARRTSRLDKPLAAHAWVECAGLIVVGGLDGLTDYAPLSRPALSERSESKGRAQS